MMYFTSFTVFYICSNLKINVFQTGIVVLVYQENVIHRYLFGIRSLLFVFVCLFFVWLVVFGCLFVVVVLFFGGYLFLWGFLGGLCRTHH